MTKEFREALLDHFAEGAPSYKTANEAVKAEARLQAERILPLIDRYAAEREREAVKRYELETSIERLDVQCSEGNCKNCDNKRPRLRKLQEELAALKETTNE